jgi:hypothetical protein
VAKIGTDKPRRQAYEFAHRAVLAIARQDPARFYELAVSDRLLAPLTALWNKVGERVPVDERLPADGMRTSVHQADDRSVVIVRPPLAKHTTEAHFIGVVIAGDRIDRYFVLEHSWKLDDTPSTWLGEWTPASHLGLGDGPPPDDENGFLQAVLSRLNPPG